MKILIFDTETSGFNPGQICQLSYIIIDTLLKTIKGKNYYFKVDYVEEGAYKTHGLSVEKLEMLSHGKTFQYKSSEIEKDFSSADILVGHNVNFDIRFIEAEFSRNNKKLICNKKFCTMNYYTDICKISSAYGKYKWPKLEEVVNYLNIPKTDIESLASKVFGGFSGYHDSRFDVISTYKILTEGLKKGLIPKNFFTEKFLTNVK